MAYQGGKTHIRKPLANIISYFRGRPFVSLFCGMCSVESAISGFDHIILNDIDPYVVALLNAIKEGWEPPSTVSKELYDRVKNDLLSDIPLSAFIGFGCSFGGSFFNGYAKNLEGRNYALKYKNYLYKIKPLLQKADILCMDYLDVSIPKDSVVYADPPYYGTIQYGNAFDSIQFFDYMRYLSTCGHQVFISELDAPKDFRCIWQKEVKRTFNKNDKAPALEKLFTFGEQKNFGLLI